MKTVILLNGKARSGKDTIARIMKRYLEVDRPEGELKTRIFSFASPLKTIIAETLGITLNDLETFKNKSDRYSLNIIDNHTGNILKETNLRKVLQLFGTEAMKPVFGENVWARLTAQKVLESDAEVFIIPDFRFMIESNEFDRLASQDKVRVFIVYIDSNLNTISENQHSSETELDDYEFDYTIVNAKGELRYTEEQVQKLLSEIL